MSKPFYTLTMTLLTQVWSLERKEINLMPQGFKVSTSNGNTKEEER